MTCGETMMGMIGRKLFEKAKRAIDVSGAIVGLGALSPIILLEALAIRLSMGSPVIFSQDRSGKDGKPFTLYKFRSMLEAFDIEGKPLSDAERLTKVGQFIRSTSLDELPQLINVLLGDMSLVGPRPLLMRYVERYNEHQRKRLDVKPGITGYSQINGRNEVGWDEKFDMDVHYVENQSLSMDIAILLRTVAKVILREGISQEGQATMEEFMGSETTYPKSEDTSE